MPLALTSENARDIYCLPVHEVKHYLPEIFRRLRKPSEQQGSWVQDYVAWLRQKFLQYFMASFGVPRGWDDFEEACVDAGVWETFMELAGQPVNEACWIAVFNALDSLCYLSSVASLEQRRKLFERIVKCNALDTLIRIIKDYKHNLHKYIAMRVLRTIAGDMFLPEILSPEKAAELVEFLAIWTRDDESRWMEQVRRPGENWQVGIMTNRLLVPREMGVSYGTRWYGMTQEFAMFAAYGALSRGYPLHSSEYFLDVLKARPAVLDALLDVAALPRPAAYPEVQIDQLASETLALLFQFPREYIAGVKTPVPKEIKYDLEFEYGETVEALKILTSRPLWKERILAVFKRLDDETFPDVQRKISRVVSDYHGVAPDDNTLKMIYDSRGQSRNAILRLVAAVTHLDNITDGELVSFLRPAYLASQGSLKKSLENFTPRGIRETCEHGERTTDAHRKATWANVMDLPLDPACIVPDQAIAGPVALLRILTVLARRGTLDAIPTWTSLPADALPGTELRQVQQITSAAVIQKLLPLAVRRVAIAREKAREWVNSPRPDAAHMARAKYLPPIELAAALLTFDEACGGRFKSYVRGAQKELVLSLGNAAEMSKRADDHLAALRFAVAADALGRKADKEEGIEPSTIEKNQRRLDAARKAVAVESRKS